MFLEFVVHADLRDRERASISVEWMEEDYDCDGHRLEGGKNYVGPLQEVSDTVFKVRDPQWEYVIQVRLGAAGGIQVKVMALRCRYFEGEEFRVTLSEYTSSTSRDGKTVIIEAKKEQAKQEALTT